MHGANHESYVAIDLGATSGRVILGRFDGARIHLEDVHRFANGPQRRAGGLFWEWPRIWQEIARGLAKAAATDRGIVSVGCDSWGHDHGFIGASGKLLEWPYAYQDERVADAARQVEARIAPLELQARTAGFHVPFSLLHQLLATVQQRPDVVREASKLLFLPSLVNHSLCGAAATEPCMASLTQLYDGGSGWDYELAAMIGLPAQLLPPIGGCGEVAGAWRPPDSTASGWDVRLVASHDTASAFAAVPLESPGNAVVSAGTWAMVGMQAPAPLVNADTFAAGIGSIRIPDGQWAVMKGMMGFYYLERFIREQGIDEPSALADQAERESPSLARFDPERFTLPEGGTFLETLQRALATEGMRGPDTSPAVARCIFDSLAGGVARAAHTLAKVLDRGLERIFLVGGGSQCRLFARVLAEAARVPVVTGIAEATAAGNVLVQARGRGRLGSLDELRAVVRNSCSWRIAEPAP